MWPLAIATLGASALSSAVSMREASKNRNFQKDLSNTAHQREVEDLKAAGLNPILSAGGGGASTPSGSMGQVSDLGNALTTGVSTAMQYKKAKQELQVLKNEAKISDIKTRLTEESLDFLGNNPQFKGLMKSAILSSLSGINPTMGAVLGNASAIMRQMIDAWKENKKGADSKAKELMDSPIMKMLFGAPEGQRIN